MTLSEVQYNVKWRDEFERMWKEAILPNFKLLFRNLSVGTEENQEILQSGHSILRLRS
jgi:hypothetical protein